MFATVIRIAKHQPSQSEFSLRTPKSPLFRFVVKYACMLVACGSFGQQREYMPPSDSSKPNAAPTDSASEPTYWHPSRVYC